MSETTAGKVQILLEKAARQSDSPTAEESSITSAARYFPGETEAGKAFSELEAKLFRIEEWNRASGFSSFELFDAAGKSQPESVAAGDFIKITMPGSGKEDWVKINEIYKTDSETILTVQPSYNPTESESKKTTSHFFTADSTNNFCLQRINAKINFYVIGLNERTNTDDTGGILETVRNYATANIGAFLGIQKTQWQKFCENFLINEQ